MPSTQYDSIGAAWDNIDKLPSSHLVELSLRQALEPLLKRGGIKALDLGCGTGLFTRALRSWGAESVLGVDISPVMIDAARVSTAEDRRVEFAIGNCSRPDIRYPQGPFDLVMGAWFLNYAASGAEMADMFRHAAGNLKEGGTFVALVPRAVEDQAAEIEKAARVRPKAVGNIHHEKLETVEDGLRVRVHVGLMPKQMQFECYLLRKSVYEKAARDGGFGGRMEWTEVLPPKQFREREDYREVWEKFDKVPHATVLVVTKD